RSRGAAHPAYRDPRRVRPGRADRAGLPHSHDRRVAVGGPRIRLLRRVRSHVADSLHRGPVRRPRAQHQHVAAADLREPHLRVPVLGAAGPLPYGNTRLQLAAAEAGLLAAQQEVNDNPAPAIPAVNQPLPRQYYPPSPLTPAALPGPPAGWPPAAA